ncbi:SLBB domain-containing protein [Gammaproteobacteria bacterium]|nr:SLBB domain-containing protein [Gammaproteobacteria bacterium]
MNYVSNYKPSTTQKFMAFFAYKACFLILLVPSISFAQAVMDTDQLLETMIGDATGSPRDIGAINDQVSSTDEGYKSFIQNEYNQVTKQLRELSLDEEEDIYFGDLRKKRIELASQLCAKDKRACFLIAEYREFDFIQPNTVEELELYGLEIFSGYANDFNFYDSLPLSGEYILRVGDSVSTLLFGGIEFNDSLKIDRTGAITIPDIGAVQIAGLSYDAALSKIKNIVADKFFGTEVSISMDQIRAMKVFVIGNVLTPGSYTLNTFGTVLNALISSGGIRDKSSLRTIEVVRGQSTIATIDLYDLLIDGKLNLVDLSLKDGDSIIVKGLINSVALIGEVNRPAIYEFIDGDTLSDLLLFGLGTTPRSDLNNISVTRVLKSGKTTVLNPKNYSEFKLQMGDRVEVNSSLGEQINYISLSGAIRNAGDFSLEQSGFLGDYINLERDLLESTYTGFAVIKRLHPQSKSHIFQSIDLMSQAALNKKRVLSGDHIFILSKNDIAFVQSNTVKNYLRSLASQNNQRDQIKQSSSPGAGIDSATIRSDDPALTRLETDRLIELEKESIARASIRKKARLSCLQALDSLNKKPLINFLKEKFSIFYSSDQDISCTPFLNQHAELLPTIAVNTVPVLGNVRFPGLYPVSSSLSALDLFYLAGGNLFNSDGSKVVYEIGTKNSSFESKSFDDLKDTRDISYLKTVIARDEMFEGYVTLMGEFKNPGTYSISSKETLSSLYKRAGGLSQQAYTAGGILTRKSVRDLEVKAIARAKSELSEILSSAVTSGYLQQNSTDLIGLISLMTDLSNTTAIGRLVTELDPIILQKNPDKDNYLEPGDVIYMPAMQRVVTVVGQILNPVTVPYDSALSFEDYIDLAGGVKSDADTKRIYAILPNGISQRNSSGLFSFASLRQKDLLPGSTIIVPRKARPLDSLALVETISPILANFSVTAAAISAISNNNN